MVVPDPAPPMAFDLCIVGHVTEDRIEVTGEPPRTQAGGTAYYAGVAAQRLGLRTAVITRLRPSDRTALLADLEALGVAVTPLPSPATTRFVNSYPDANLDARSQKVMAVAAPFAPEDLDVEAPLYLLGPLTARELSLTCVHHLAHRGRRIALDVQGLIRTVHGEQVVRAPNEELFDWLRWVNMLKADRDEALLVTGAPTLEAAARQLAAAGPQEVIITSGSQGAHLFAEGQMCFVPAYPAPTLVDTTGCGDTYFAAYVARRLAGDTVEQAGHVAAAVASAKTAYHGAFCGVEADGDLLDRWPAVLSASRDT